MIIGIIVALSTYLFLVIFLGKKRSKREKGELQISEIVVQQNETEGTCALDFRVHNIGGSDVQINRVNFRVVEVNEINIMGFQKMSKLYDLGLDISELKKTDDFINCVVSQNIKPGRTDRFGIILIARNMGTGVFKCWKLKPKLITNFGDVPGEPIEVWLPYIPEAFSQPFKEKMYKELGWDIEKEGYAHPQRLSDIP